MQVLSQRSFGGAAAAGTGTRLAGAIGPIQQQPVTAAGYGLQVASPRIQATREQLAQSFLPQYGEDELAQRVLTITDAELDRIGELAAYYAWSDDALELLGGSMGGTRALCLATIDVLDRTLREPHRSQSLQERGWGTPARSDAELAQEHSLRRRATTNEPPASEA